MKKQILFVLMVLGSMSLFAQVSDGDIQMVQKYFGADKLALVKEYMALSPAQDSAFWPVYNKYETERQALGKQRIDAVKAYMANVKDITAENATKMVDKGVALELSFKSLQKKYFTELSKKVGPVKAAQFYQLENYINNVINLSIQESIPFVGEMEQKHAGMPKKK